MLNQPLANALHGHGKNRVHRVDKRYSPTYDDVDTKPIETPPPDDGLPPWWPRPPPAKPPTTTDKTTKTPIPDKETTTRITRTTTDKTTTTTTTTTPEETTTKTTPLTTPKATPNTTTPKSSSTAPMITPPKDETVTHTSTHTKINTTSGTSLAAAASDSATAPPHKTSKGVMVGGIIAAVIAIIGIIFAIAYFVRRARASSKQAKYDQDEYRRESKMMDDGWAPTRNAELASARNAGGTPRPPTMIEQKLAYQPPSYGSVAAMPPVPRAYGYGDEYNTGYNDPYHGAYAPQQPFQPDQFVPYSDNTPTSSNPFFTPFAAPPMGSPRTPSPYNGVPEPRRQTPPGGAYVTRQNSSGSNKDLPPPPANDYVDLSRSSVTPYQAAQYAEISRRLDAEPPKPLPPSVVEEEYAEAQAAQQQREKALPEASPFADPEPQVSHQKNKSVDSVLEPPEPIHSPKERVTSIPPSLPEIALQERPFSPMTVDFPIAPSSVRPSPSPFTSTFDLPSPPPAAHSAADTAAPAPIPRDTKPSAGAQRPDTVYTVYGDDDAYGGI